MVVRFHLDVFVSRKPIAPRPNPGERISHACSSGVQQRLGRNTPNVRAVAADLVAFDQHDVVAEVGQPDRHGQATRTSANHGGLVGGQGVVANHVVLSSVERRCVALGIACRRLTKRAIARLVTKITTLETSAMGSMPPSP